MHQQLPSMVVAASCCVVVLLLAGLVYLGWVTTSKIFGFISNQRLDGYNLALNRDSDANTHPIWPSQSPN